MIEKRANRPLRKPAMATSFAMLVMLLISCSLPSLLAATTPTPQPSPTPLPALNTPTPMAPTPTSISTQVPTATATATPSAINIVFSPGTTAAAEQGTIQPNQVQSYTLSAGQYQPMILILEPSNAGAYLGVTEHDGNKLLDPAKKWTNWQWLLPKTEVYTIQVFGGASAENYTLTTKVAERVTLPAGGTSITRSGSTPNGFVFSYALACQANQTMTVSLNVPASTAYLDVVGLATGVLLSSSSKVNTWTGTLPATEDYIIEVIPNNGQVVNYSLTVSVH
jgi:hypothetical protein